MSSRQILQLVEHQVLAEQFICWILGWHVNTLMQLEKFDK